MSDTINPVEDAWMAVKNRSAGPIGTFVLVWSLSHWKVLSFILFDAAGESATPQAQAKISAVSNLLMEESISSLLLSPILIAGFVLIFGQILQLGWHWLSDQFRYLRDKISYKNDLRISLHRRFGKNPDELLATIRGEISNSITDVNNIVTAGDHIQAVNELAKLQATVSSVNQKATDISAKLKDALALIELASDKPLISHFRESKENFKNKHFSVDVKK